MKFKVYGGTPSHDAASLCSNCRFARIIRGHRLEEELVFCDATAMNALRVTFKVASCSNFLDDRQPTYHELLEQAWILRPASKRRAAGFVRASDLSEAEAMRMFTAHKEE